MRPSFLASLIFVAAVLSGSAPAYAAKCVIMIVKDPNGIVVQVEGKPIVGIVVGDDTVTGLNIPPTFDKRVGPETICPPERIAAMQALFDESCLTETRRAQAATQSQVPVETVNKRCGDMAETLGPGR
jgi:hypothetical protein